MNKKSAYQIEQNMLNFGMKNIYTANDHYNVVVKPKDVEHYEKIYNLKVVGEKGQ